MTAGYSFTIGNMEAAGRHLGLTHGVRVFIWNYRWGDGRYIGLRDGEHRIGVAADLSAREASRAQSHELTHAVQVERLGGQQPFDALWWEQMRDLGLSRQEALRGSRRRYSHAPLEAEAEANERLHRRLPLAHRCRGPSMLPWPMGERA